MEIVPSSSRFKLYDQFELLEFPDKYVVKPIESPEEGFSVDRRDGNIKPLDENASSGNPTKVSTIYGVGGTIRLLAGTYLLVITSREEVGNFLGFPIFRVTAMKFLPCNEALRFATAQEKKDETYFRTLLQALETTPGLYFSYETDLTLNLQRRCKLAEGWKRKPMWKQADPRYVWNWHLLEELIECKLDGFIIPLLQGSYQVAELKLKNSPAVISIISRRCTRRLGTRMWRRGANLEGDTANFVESEQIVEINGFKFSLLQVRGSIPLLWEQIVDLSYKPRLKINKHEDTPKVVQRHFHDLCQRYGEIIAVDLTDQHGDEGELSKAYATEMEKLPDVRYVSFDFHQICGTTNFDNLRVLYEQIGDEFEKQGYFLVDADENILEEQKGVIRSNCIDCLDRTNVTQSYMGQKSVNLQLQRIEVFDSTECISTFEDDYTKFRTIWAEQGDEVSLQYAGTYALKGDLVRYGKQTMTGAIKDGLSAMSRYYLNNFQDGVRQDALDLISGRYTVGTHSPSQLQPIGSQPSFLPVASALLIGGVTVTSFTIHQAGRNTQQYLASALWAGVTAGVVAMIKANGRHLCSRPRLCHLI
ncbi:phosphoinositide phosphatase SAC8 isoform X1 [Arabidopsis lyrata subsp. lyrata]|uniref:phosphoinositide phosphatase SAC8 isoform X1 n=1 Tax=Arabidopsis lyrata subsp. lyrata TaxID=81972 RepID=UPI000A29B699|nr:phosphoinositide phosphatase SAC8 isoform X1 [Arabidopsis lyrata subsp. lyrata]|eukprot:XP_020882616.1 phosphoinositide phosphatase SAC8 isoform X1 [Arabidopsis lyrata subsp. lyrata]